MNRFLLQSVFVLFSGMSLIAFSRTAIAQSSNQNFPTPLTTNEVNGEIKARDIGDSRLTRHFYSFNGLQGDVFINVVTKNFNGDIDVFTADTLRPLTKMVIYADTSSNETGRVVYLRKNEQLLLRIEGRSPDDDPATYRIKFAGTFEALVGQKGEDAPTIKSSGSDDRPGVKVNSVGTIIEVKSKPQAAKQAEEVAVKPPPTEKPAPSAEEPKDIKNETRQVKSDPGPKTILKDSKTDSKVGNKASKSTPKQPEKAAEKPTVVEKQPKVETAAEEKTVRPEEKKPDPKTATAESSKEKPPTVKVETPARTSSKTAKPEIKVKDPLSSIKLVIRMKSGNVVESPMSEILKFSVENAELVVIGKDGSTSRYSILDVAKITIQ